MIKSAPLNGKEPQNGQMVCSKRKSGLLPANLCCVVGRARFELATNGLKDKTC